MLESCWDINAVQQTYVLYKQMICLISMVFPTIKLYTSAVKLILNHSRLHKYAYNNIVVLQ